MQQSPVAPATDPDGEPDPPADLRLLAPALGAEAGAVVGLLLPGRAVVVLLAVAVLGLLAVWRRRTRTAALVAGAFLLVFAGSLAGAGLRAESRSSGPVAEAAAREAAVTVELVLTGDPRPTSGGVRGDSLGRESVVVEARLVRLRAGAAEPVRVRQPVLLIAPAEGWRTLLPTQRVEAAGRLVPPRGSDLAAVLLTGGPPTNVGSPSWSQRQAGSLRAGLRQASAHLPADARGLLPGLVVGDTSGMSDELRDDARQAGLSHLTAVSGANCAIVLALVLALVRPTPLGRFGRSALAAGGLVGFVMLARPSPSVLRSALMGLIALLALALGRPRAAMPALLGAGTLLVLADPDLALAPGFVLSVLATASLLTLAPRWAEAFSRRMPRWLAQTLAVPLAAQAAVTPVVVLLSGSISLIAVPANVLAAPAVPLATVAGVVAAVLAPVTPTGARLAATVGGAPCSWIAAIAHRAAWIRGGSIAWPRTVVGALLAAAAVVLLVVLLRRHRSRRVLTAAVAGVLLASLVLPRTGRVWPPPGWVLVACDVGQGDALLIRGSPDDPPVLVDAGPDPRALRNCLDGLGVDKLAAVALSHLHADHVEGLPAVLGRLPTPAVFVNPLDEPAGESRRVRRWAAASGLPLTVLSAGQQWTAGGVQFEVIGPARTLRGTESDPNNNSTVLLAKAGRLSVLLTGDAETDAQAALLARGVPDVDVLKLPHHGSADQEPRFLAAVGARVALASVGADNPYGHPSPRTVDLLERAGARTLRTDRDGSVAIALQDGRLDVRPAKRSDSRPAPATRVAVSAPVASSAPTREVAHPFTATRHRGTCVDGADVIAAGETPGAVAPRPRARSPPSLVHRRAPLRRRASRAVQSSTVMPPNARSAPRAAPGNPAARKGPPPLTIVTGDEDLLVTRAVADVLAAVKAVDPESAAEEYAAGTFAADHVLELRNPPLFGGTRVVVIRGLNELGDEVLDALVATAEQPIPEVLIVGIAAGRERKQTAALRKLAGTDNVRSAAKITRPKDRRTFVLDEAKRTGIRLTDAAVWALLDAVGADLRSLAGALTQLRDAASSGRNPRAPLDEDDVGRLFRGKAETRGFAVSDAVVAGDTAAALSLLRSAIETGLDPVPIVSVIASSLRDLARVVGETSSGRSVPRAELARRLGMPDWKLDKVQSSARQWSDAALSRALQAAAWADAGVKGAAADPVYVVERLVLEATSARNGRAALAAGGVRR